MIHCQQGNRRSEQGVITGLRRPILVRPVLEWPAKQRTSDMSTWRSLRGSAHADVDSHLVEDLHRHRRAVPPFPASGRQSARPSSERASA
eukprot:6206885-Pleurochrysis_carterae.AAC.1